MALRKWIIAFQTPTIIDRPCHPKNYHSCDSFLESALNVAMKIDSSYFQSLREGCDQKNCFLFSKLFRKVEQYFVEHFMKRVRRTYTRRVLLDRNIQNVGQMLFYLSLQTNVKQEAASIVLQMPSQEQQELMLILQSIEQQLISEVSFKEVVQSLQLIQAKNERLRMRLEEEQAKMEKLSQISRQLEEENTDMKLRQQSYQKQREEAFLKLSVGGIEQLISECHQLKASNGHIQSQISFSCSRREDLLQSQKQLSYNVRQKGTTVTQLYADLMDLKEKNRQVQKKIEEASLLDCTGKSQQEDFNLMIPPLALQDCSQRSNRMRSSLNNIKMLSERLSERTYCKTSRDNSSHTERQTIQNLLSLHKMKEQLSALKNKLKEINLKKAKTLHRNISLSKRINKIVQLDMRSVGQYFDY